jgi:hypothetical protein
MDSNKREQSGINDNVVLMLDPNENDSMLSLKDLLYALLRNLGIILIVAVLLGGVLFAYKITRTGGSATGSNVLNISAQHEGESDVEYQLRKQKVGRAKDLAITITKINSQIDHQRRYLSDSVYMQIDAENVYETKVQYVITLKDNATAGVDRALVNAYQNAISSGTYLDDYAKEHDLKSDYIKEVISFESAVSDSTIFSTENGVSKAASFTAKIIGPSNEFTGDIADLIEEKVEASFGQLKNNVADHKITLVAVQDNIKVDAGIRDNQANQTTRIETLQKQIIGFNDALDQIAKDLGVSGKEEILEYFASEDLYAEAGVPAADNAENVSFWGTVKPGIKYGVIGFVAGFAVVAVILVLAYVFGKKITTQAQFFGKFKSVKKIGVMKPTGKRCKYTEFIDVRSEDDSVMSAENNTKLIANNYSNITKGLNKVLITGTGEKKAMEETVKKLGIKGDFKPDLFSDPDILKLIPDYDGVVLLEQRKVSLSKNIANEIDLINNAGTKIIGAIII